MSGDIVERFDRWFRNGILDLPDWMGEVHAALTTSADEIERLRAALHVPESCETVQDLVDLLGEREAYTKIVADSIGHRAEIERLRAALKLIQGTASAGNTAAWRTFEHIARRALGDNDE